jgi:sulfate adenylyltransferase subunit 1
MYLLENLHISSDRNFTDPRFPVQYVIRPQSDEFHDYRGYAGRVAGGIFKNGDNITVLPSGLTSKIKSIDTMKGSHELAFPPQSVTLTLEDDIDISRGDMIVKENNLPQVGQDITMMICWLNEKPLHPGVKYHLKHTTKDVKCIVKEIHYKMNINNLEKDFEDKHIGLNEIAQVSIRTTQPLCYDSYRKNRTTGSLILIEEGTNETVCAGMIV